MAEAGERDSLPLDYARAIRRRGGGVCAVAVLLGVLFPILLLLMLWLFSTGVWELSHLGVGLILSGTILLPLTGFLLVTFGLENWRSPIGITAIILNGGELFLIAGFLVGGMIVYRSAETIPNLLLVFIVAGVPAVLMLKARRGSGETGEGNLSELSIAQVAPEYKTRRKFELWMEVAVVLLVCVGPWLFNSYADIYLIQGRGPVNFLYHSTSTIALSSGKIALVLYLIWRSKEPLAHFGLKRFRTFTDVMGGMGIWALYLLLYRLIWMALPMVVGHENYVHIVRNQFQGTFSPPSNAREYVLFVVACAVNGVTEELLMRAYLITRLEELLESSGLAVLFSTVLFAGYHTYQGTWSVAFIAVLGVLYGCIFCVFRRFAPLAIAHALADIMAVLRRM